MKTHRPFPLICLAFLTILLATPLPLRAQDDGLPDPQASLNDAWLSIDFDPLERARFTLGVPLRVKDRTQLERSLKQAFRFPVYFEAPTQSRAEKEELDEFGTQDYWTTISGEGPNAFTGKGLKSWCQVDLEPLLETLRAQEIERLKIWVMFENNYKVKIAGTEERSIDGRIFLNFHKLEIDVRQPHVVGFDLAKGYSALDILIRATPLFLFLLLPPLWIIGRSLSAPKFAERPEQLWGTHLLFLHRLLFALWLIWLPVGAFSGLYEVISYAFRPYGVRVSQSVIIVSYFAPLIAVMFLCHFASARIYRFVQAVEWSPRKVVQRIIWLNVFSLMPLILLVLIINSLSRSLRQAALFGVIGFVVWLLLNNSLTKVWGSKVHALTSGELRDRIFELARQAGVLLKQIYVLPEDRAQLSNAFARSDDTVMISNSLIKNLSRREVDAIIAHEIGHLKEKHPHTSNTVMLVVMIVTNVVVMTLQKVIDAQHSIPVMFSATLAIGSLVIFFISRKNERKADAIGISLTGDPEAFISGFAKLSRLNLMPLHSGGWGESIETHPNSMRRLADIANTHRISSERFQSLVSDTATVAESSYPSVETLETERPIFPSDLKAKYRGRFGLTVCATLVVTPIPFAWMLDRVESPFWISVTAVAGLVLSLAVGQLVRNKWIYWGQRGLASQLRARFEARGLTEIAKYGTLVGLAPAGESRTFEGYKFWDIGLVWVTREKLYYFGERIEFALERSQVTEVCAADADPEWLAEKNLYVTWRQNSHVANNVIHFVAVGQSSMFQGRRAIGSLHKQLEVWLSGREEFPPSPPSLSRIDEPVFPEITSSPTVTSFQAEAFAKASMRLAGFAAALGFAVQLSFWSIGYVAVVVTLCILIDELAKFFKRPYIARQTDLSDGPSGPSPAPTYQVGSWADSNPATSTTE